MDITCICMTHGRPWLLSEAVESFRRQELGGLSAELLIVNDCLEQRLVCDVPSVTILQGMPQFNTVEAKYNWTSEIAGGTWLAFWDDDDISLPRRLAYTMSLATQKENPSLLRPLWLWHMANGTIRGRGGAQICHCIVRRAAWLEVGGGTPGEWIDQSLYFKLKRSGPYVEPQEVAEDCHYIYRWAGVGYHDSGEGIQDPEVRARRFHEEAVKDPRFKAGEVRVVPKWEQDYVAEAKRAVDRGLYQVRI
jgi:hypothetical protein